jgi:hypothetical protein
MDLNNRRRPTLAEMLKPSSEPATLDSAPPPPKRRLTLAEMLKQSPLAGNTVPLVEAVESAQAAKARKEEGEVQPPPAVERDQWPLTTACAEQSEPTGPNRYNLYAKVEGKWVWQVDVHAASHADGMRLAIAWLKPEHDLLAIRLEQDDAVGIK